VTITREVPTLPTSAAALEDLDRQHLVHPHQSGDRPGRCVLVRGEGCVVWDARGNELLDATGGGNWVCQVGHGREELAEAAASQIRQLAYYSSFMELSNDKSVRLAARLAGLAPDGLNRIFFTSGGSEGVETALKIARLFHHNRGAADRNWIIARHLGYHGAAYGSGTATGWPQMQQGIGPNLPNVEKVSPPYLYRASEFYGDQDPTDFLLNELEQTIERIGPEKIAAMIGEPVMGGGGVLAPPADYWPRVRELLSSHGILLIADEVVTAYGRTGAWFDSVRRGMQPDLIVTAKGITSGYQPLGAVLMRDEIAETIAGKDAYFFHGYTYFGHPVACAVALENLNLIEGEGLIGRAASIGTWFRAGLAPAQQLPHVGDVRVEGATVGIELVADRETRQPILGRSVVTELQRVHGIIIRDYGPTLVLSPSLVMTEDQVGRACGALVEVLSRLGADGQVSPR
jgi:PLP-dependent transaminase